MLSPLDYPPARTVGAVNGGRSPFILPLTGSAGFAIIQYPLKNTFGLILMYGGFGLSMTVFLYHGFFKGVPLSLEEAAVIDGANIFQLFFKVVFPLVKPITATVVITNAMWIWNDYLLPFLIIGNNDSKTLTLSLYYAKSLSGQYGNPWELIFPAVLICVIPILVVFIFLQKNIIEGIAAGAVKAEQEEQNGESLVERSHWIRTIPKKF